eukprot:16441560-Heterocapsa_arctica.AAC.1
MEHFAIGGCLLLPPLQSRSSLMVAGSDHLQLLEGLSYVHHPNLLQDRAQELREGFVLGDPLGQLESLRRVPSCSSKRSDDRHMIGRPSQVVEGTHRNSRGLAVQELEGRK